MYCVQFREIFLDILSGVYQFLFVSQDLVFLFPGGELGNDRPAWSLAQPMRPLYLTSLEVDNSRILDVGSNRRDLISNG